ncbi:MAG TPA: hypothetical protein PLP56_01090 [Candidatus Omnitrophota bacterium]|nr:hypothetical protein [Candidatus Omnitrophota bacterium]HNQ49819.1 hypothetical protein [Candidatus Omnitrophota bacterium]HQO38381.1 hypothetical protein [Candidatus Omnitrophota bacterium]HQQ05560.1 hypothetical protein [Candidatus Omnitrophota bacterium]
MNPFTTILSRLFAPVVKMVFSEHSMHAFINGTLVRTTMLFDIDGTPSDRGGFASRFTAEYQRLKSLHLQWTLARPFMMVELQGSASYRKDFQDLLAGTLSRMDEFRQVLFLMNGKRFFLVRGALKEVPAEGRMSNG